MFAVTLGAMIALASFPLPAQVVTPQFGHKQAPDKGPRALGLVQLSSKGKARIIPIAIMMDGKFYDAGAYKASPVPMALEYGVVYEAFRTGVSQGTFTITQPGQLNRTWIAEGRWLPAGAMDAQKKKKYSAPVIADDDKDDRPVLHRRVPKTDSDSDSGDSKDKDKDKDKDKTPDQQKPSTASVSPAAPPTASVPASTDTPSATDSAKASAKASAPATSSKGTAGSSKDDESVQDPSRPRLRRGKPDPKEQHEAFTTFDALDAAPAATTAGKTGATVKDAAVVTPPPATLIPAISDVGGPEPRPYTYDLKPAEEAIYRNKMLELATEQLRAQSSAATKQTTAARKAPLKSASNSADKTQPVFDSVSLRIFDLSSSNEPVLVFSAKTHPQGNDSSEPKEITLIARTNLEGELRKLFFSQTDSRHLDVAPHMELIDAVDADGDGRGELLFRRTFDEGSAYAIYRVSADRLWPLFEGTP